MEVREKYVYTKVVFKTTLLVLTILLFVNCVSSDIRTTVEGISVAKERGQIDCDTLICPFQETNLCRVVKIFDSNDSKYFIRIRKCIDSNGDVLKKETFREPIGKFNRTIKVTFEPKVNGVIFSDPIPEDAAK